MTAKRLPAIVLLAMAASSALYAQDNGQAASSWSKGPLVGRNWYLPFSIYYHYPGYSARSGKQSEFQYRFSQYYSNDFSASFVTDYANTSIADPPPGYPSSYYVSRDFESYNAELGFSYRPSSRLALGLDLRLVSFFGGFLDSFIGGFHGLFGFPNGGREFSPPERVLVDIQNASGVRFSLDSSTVSLGDIDLHARYTFLEKQNIAMAAYGAVKLPAGRLESLSGSGYPDIAFGMAADYLPNRAVSIFAQAGITVPFDSFLSDAASKPSPFFTGMTGLAFAPARQFSLNVQLNLKSPSLEPSLEDDLHWLFTDTNRMLLPQVCLLAGCIRDWPGMRWQFYFEEDPLTNTGVDITFNLSFTRTME